MLDLNGIKVKNRIWLAAGAGGYGEGWPHQKPFIKLGLIDFSAFGAIITRTLTPESRQGNYIDPFEFENATLVSHLCRIFSEERKRVLRKVLGGWINNVGWWNVGINYWIEKIYPWLHDVAIIPNIGGFTIYHYVDSIRKLNHLDIVGIEINISCPNIEHPLSKDPAELMKLFTFCRESSDYPFIVKLGIDSDYVQIARLAEYCGFNAVSAINAIPALGGGYSGSAIKPIALKVVADLKKAVKIPVIGGGGIASLKDCQEFFEVGADAVALGSGFLLKPWEPTRIAKKYEKVKDQK
ncbi:MAG: nitronate monooxygenase [Candidatus Nealsonbacteria bacterium]|nr:nitronate monooxygenase [Candidatus Nealsonbacteria bacterium]